MGKQIIPPEKSDSELKSREVAEAAREEKWEKRSFLKELFLGNLRLDLLEPFPVLTGVEDPEFRQFCEKLQAFLDRVDSDAIDREGKIPPEHIRELAEMGVFGMKIDKKYGGLGFTLGQYIHVLKLLSSRDSNITALVSAHQSIGVPQPLAMFGTEEQKAQYLPRIARGAITAFALTEPEVGSDPARLSTTVTESADGHSYILNGTKLWTTNGTIAELAVVMARHAEDGAISAFIVEMNWPGVEVPHRCRFMGLRALENGVLRFTDVKIPKENLLWKRGQGLKLALITLNVGRLALPACAAGGAKICLEIARKWAVERRQWGRYIGHHEAITHKIADMAAHTFALDAITDLATGMAERDFDIRLEAAVAKLYNTEAGWKIVDDTLQIRGGRGYETADSLRERGEKPLPVERFLRDWRINTIFEGSSEILRLFIAREAVDQHLQVAGVLLDRKADGGQKLKALPGIAGFYAIWFSRLWLPGGQRFGRFERCAKHLRFARRTSRKLARHIFYGMIRHQAKLEKRQAFLGHVVDIGAELFAMVAVITRAKQQFDAGNRNAMNLADIFCRQARRRIAAHFYALWHNEDRLRYKLGRQVLDKQFTWLEHGSAGLSALKPEPAKKQDDLSWVEEALSHVVVD